jgi:hypothetical protein
MSGAVHEPRAQWLLLDGPDAPQAGADAQQAFTGVPCFGLFEGTEFAPVSEHGPPWSSCAIALR